MLLVCEKDRATALALAGAAPFDPMGNGALRTDKVQMPEALLKQPAELRKWLARSFEYAATLPAKARKAKAAKPRRTSRK